MSHRMDEVQDRLQQISISLDWFRSEHSKVIHEYNKRSQHRFSMRKILDRLTSTLVMVTEENQFLKAGPPMNADRPAESEKDEFESTAEPEEQVRRGTSTIHRKKARSNLRSPEVETCASQLKNSHEQLVHSPGRRTDDLLKEISATRAELLTLQSKLKSAETHIVKIGGNLGALLPRETVKNEFSSLIVATQIWVSTCVLPSISSAEQCFQASERARNVWAGDTALCISRWRNRDFFVASEFPAADENIFLVMIFDILIDKAFFAKVRYLEEDLQREIDVIKQLEISMNLNLESSRSLYNARRWMSEALAAILAREETQAFRDDFSHVLTHFIIRSIGLAEVLGPNKQAALDIAAISIRQDVVLPAIELGDKMLCAIDKYSLDVSSYWSVPCAFQTQFFRDLENLDCKNLSGDPPRFKLEKMQKRLSDDEIKDQLKAICPAIPALLLTEVDDRTWGPPTILVKEQVWVAWHSRRNLTLRPEERGFFWFLYNREAIQYE
ncbi:hypothetical protein INS49_004715 [Diaporthe citri]|uniref:uncharacterized protein n=1 Tax=Diaporthe citri TaxID=83186 RepID=UPI001C7FDE30|nr:uncharacterized protein INS49_004715 [Diaporthe citri]KAG6354697.1 hypothetical protein INS49_004715 [Diaporthe citri]